MPRLGRTLIAALVAALALVLVSPATAGAPTRFERAVLTHVNKARAAHDLKRVRFAQPLQTRSHRYAARLRRTGSFEHANIPPGTCENLAWGTTNIMSARRIVRMWMKSPGHRACLLWRPARRAGIGVVRGPYAGYPDVRVAVARLRRP